MGKHTSRTGGFELDLTRPPADSLVGEVVGGKFVIQRLLGEGGMARVYRAWHRVFEREVALKVIRKEFKTDTKFRARFLQEAKIAANLEHPGIIRVLEVSAPDEDQLYLVMELIEGESLAEKIPEIQLEIKQDPAGATRRIARIGMVIADALVTAHAAGVVHRDLKPENILIGEGDRVVVTDFGIARILTASANPFTTGTQGIIGTPAYMAPECMRIAPEVDARTDLYSLGCMLFEMCAGAPPFGNVEPAVEGRGTPVDIMFHHLSTPPPPPPVPDPALTPLIMKLLQKKPEDRYQEAAEVREALRAIMNAPALPAPVPVRGPGRRSSVALEPLQVSAPRRSFAPTLILLVLAAIAGGGAWWMWKHRPWMPRVPVISTPERVQRPVAPQAPPAPVIPQKGTQPPLADTRAIDRLELMNACLGEVGKGKVMPLPCQRYLSTAEGAADHSTKAVVCIYYRRDSRCRETPARKSRRAAPP